MLRTIENAIIDAENTGLELHDATREMFCTGTITPLFAKEVTAQSENCSFLQYPVFVRRNRP